MSQPFVIITVTNRGPMCTIDGYPRIAAASGHADTQAATTQLPPIVLLHGADYEHADPGPHQLDIAPGATASFALGTNTASGPVYILSGLRMGLPSSASTISVAVDLAASAAPKGRLRMTVTAFVSGSTLAPAG